MKTVLAPILLLAVLQPALAQCPDDSCTKSAEAVVSDVAANISHEPSAPSLLGTLVLLDPINGNYQMRASLPVTDTVSSPVATSQVTNKASVSTRSSNTSSEQLNTPTRSAGANPSSSVPRANSARGC